VVVNLKVKLDIQANGELKSGAKTRMKEEKRHEVIDLPDDGEYGGELAGRLVWEAYEANLKVWERENPKPVEDDDDRKEESGCTETGIRTQTGQKNEEDIVEERIYV
jgi:hypothetical protein